MKDDYSTRYSPFGFNTDVRESFSHLPCQFFWTWLSGKETHIHAKRHPRETLLSPLQLGLQLSWSWSIIIVCQIIGYMVYHSDLSAYFALPLYLIIWILVTNRTRGLLHTFHYTNHGASVQSKKLAKFLATWFMSIPILHLSWDNYYRIHAVQHHGSNTLCTIEDPDEKFMHEHGFYPNMPEKEFWLRLVFAPFHPLAFYRHIKFRFDENFITCSSLEKVFRYTSWIGILSAVFFFGIAIEFALFYMFPLLIVTQFSSWIQHVTEHMWFSKPPKGVNKHIYYGSLTWGRFLGRPYPHGQNGLGLFFRKCRWFFLAFCCDLPIKLFSFMQDLPSHDFHHRSPLVNFWAIARERRAAENKKNVHGPMTESWGLIEAFLIVRDSICYQKHDPFDVLKIKAKSSYEH